MIEKGSRIKESKVLILGITFKENCPDIRNSKVIDIYNELVQFGLAIEVYDPNANESDVFDEYAINLVKKFDKYDGIILAVAHDEFLNLDLSTIKSSSQTVVFDLKAVLARNGVDARL